MRSWMLGALLLALTGSCAADAAAGRAKAAAACVMCHGALGMSVQPGVPNLAGQQELYLAEQLRNFRNGKRASEVMAVIAKPLSNDDIDNLAAWYGSLRVQVEAP